ncbi:MAG: hypothetical protein JWO22_447, partial [Frankiales bacterium]|nr:hypothetical protein [Frankiales bacterium]
AQIGEDRAPDGYVPDAAAESCRKCSRPWALHERHRKDSVVYLLCPSSEPEASRP